MGTSSETSAARATVAGADDRGPVPTLPVAIPAIRAGGHVFSSGTAVSVEVRVDDVRIVDDAGDVVWDSPRRQVRLSGAGLPGLGNWSSSELTLRSERGSRAHLIFTDPTPAKYLTVAVVCAVVLLFVSMAMGVLAVVPGAIAINVLLAVLTLGTGGLRSREDQPGARHAVIESIRSDT